MTLTRNYREQQKAVSMVSSGQQVIELQPQIAKDSVPVQQ